MMKVTVDGVTVEVPNGYSVIQACEAAGKEIPRFCYHERLSVAGNCRMCLVEVEKAPKPVASCAYPAADGMVVKTDSAMVKEARHGVMEFLLINHPLDCPVCDQGGECDLQDQAMAYGRDRSRYAEEKRAVKDKYLGPLVKTVMTRCIQCTRCVRFSTEVAGVSELGAVSRGEGMEIGPYIEKALTSELSGNLVDICPVGALTHRPYAYVARPWELKRFDSIDVSDATGSNISINARGNEVLRILPRPNDDVNEEWLADKGRYFVDGLKKRRLDRPWLRVDGQMKPASWSDAFAAIAAAIARTAPDRIGAVAGNLCDAESMLALKQLMDGLGSRNVDCRQDGTTAPTAHPSQYLFNSGIAGIDDADLVILVGVDPRTDSPIINSRIHRRWNQNPAFRAIGIGEPADLTYPCEWIGTSLDALTGDPALAEAVRAAARPMVILGQGPLLGGEGGAVHAAVTAMAASLGVVKEGWNGLNVLQQHAARVGGQMLGLVPEAGAPGAMRMAQGEVDLLWLMGADELDLSAVPDGCFVVYQGHHGDRGAARADAILPGAAFSEKDGIYVNTEGRIQIARKAVFAPGEAQEDWRILQAFARSIGQAVSGAPLRDQVMALLSVDRGPVPSAGKAPTLNGPIRAARRDYYLTDAICRASDTMRDCAVQVAASRAEDVREADRARKADHAHV